MNNHPLYNKVKEIITRSAVDGIVSHKDFDCIRNKASLRAILTDMGYTPNCEVSPYTWKLNAPIVSKPKNQLTGNNQEGSAYALILELIENYGVFYIKTLGVSRKRAMFLASRLVQSGYKLERITNVNQEGKGRKRTVGYKLAQ